MSEPGTDFRLPCTEPVCHTAVVVGSGAAGLACVCMLRDRGVDAVLLTEDMNAGTSRNTGSDKQTYHRLSLLDGDSVDRMAADLFACGAVDGDNALCEAALSAPCFDRLCELGVPFPYNEYGEYPGYQTDHSESRRATSAGPLTSRWMTERWEAALRARNVPVYDHMLAARLITCAGAVCGLVAFDLLNRCWTPFAARYVVWATGGPAGVYAERVYPESQRGCTGVPLLAGAAVQNLTEWQYGLASTAPVRWNLSGSYQQVLPRYLCGGAELLTGADESVWRNTFLKGYQWPFDPNRLPGSSDVDLAVYRASLAGRQVYLDFTENPRPETFSFSRLPSEAREYLEKSGADASTPYERLMRMNPDAAALYRAHGLELSREPLPVAVCAQHCNGGLSVDADWQTTLPGLYAIGECAGTHGIRRPGGSALNAGQVGAQRAAGSIASRSDAPLPDGSFVPACREALAALEDLCAAFAHGRTDAPSTGAALARRMSDTCGILREPDAVREADAYLSSLGPADFGTPDADGLAESLRLYDTFVTQRALTAAVRDYIEQGCGSRGSSLIPGRAVDLSRADRVQELRRTQQGFCVSWRPVRPIPERETWFERVWSDYRRRMGNAGNQTEKK